jgi:hypothetical protein
MPIYLAEEEPYRPDVAIWRPDVTIWFDATNELIVAYELQVPPTPHKKVAQLLDTAMRKPLMGSPRRPARIRVEDEALADLIRRRYGNKIEVLVAPIPELQELVTSLSEMPIPESDEDVTGYLHEDCITPEIVAPFFRSASRLYRKAPWGYMTDDFLLKLDIPAMGIEDACISIIGAVGESYGFLIFESIEDFGIMADRSEEILSKKKRRIGVPIFSVNFDRGSDLSKSMRKQAAQHGWEVPGPNAFPSIFRLDADGIAIPPGPRDYRLATLCSEALTRFFSRYGKWLKKGLLPEDSVTGRYTIRELSGQPVIKITVPHPEAFWVYWGEEEDEAEERARKDPSVKRKTEKTHDRSNGRQLSLWGQESPQNPPKTDFEGDSKQSEETRPNYLPDSRDASPSTALRAKKRIGSPTPHLRVSTSGRDSRIRDHQKQDTGLSPKGMTPKIQPAFKKVRRNDPCPCGSGKKYKKCCLGKTEISDELLWSRLRSAHDRLVDRLMDYARHLHGPKGLAEAVIEFFPPFDVDATEDPLAGHEQLFAPWFLFNWIPRSKRRNANGKTGTERTVAEEYAEKKGRQLDPLEQRLLDATVGRPFSFYEVLQCQPGRGFTLRDVFTGEMREILERMGSEGIQVGDILYGRLSQVDIVTILVGSGTMALPPSCKPDLIRLRRGLLEKHGQVTDRELTDHAIALRRLYLGLFDASRRPPQLCNTDGDPLLLHKIHYEIDSPEVAFEGLKKLSVLEDREALLDGAERDGDGNLHKVTIPWTRKERKTSKGFQSTLLGSILIDGRSMTVEVNSSGRARTIQRTIKRRLGEHATYKTTVTTSPQTLLAPGPEDMSRTFASTVSDKELIEHPEAREELREMVHRQWVGWMDQNIPAL